MQYSKREVISRTAWAVLLGMASLVGPLVPGLIAQQYTFGRADLSGAPAATAVVTGDFNGDGRPDLAVSENFSGAGLISVLLANPDGTYPNPGGNVVVNAYEVGANPYSLVAGDFNGDGKLDLAVPNNGDGTISVLLGYGDGTFQPQVVYPTGPAPVSIAAADLNGDGKLDLVVNSRDSASVGVLLGNGDGTFQAHADYATAAYPSSVAIADVNNDGKPDVIVGAIEGFSVLLGNGDGTLQTHIDTAAYDSAFITAADFNHDGVVDLAILSINSPGLSIFIGKGDGTFQAGSSYEVGSGPVNLGIISGDFNGDGNPDLAATTSGPPSSPANSVSILLGNRDGTFKTHVDYATGLGPAGLAALDANGDGRLDLAIADAGGNAVGGLGVSVLLGNGDGTFQPQPNYVTAIGSGAAIAADFNGDGKPDLVSVGGDAQSTDVVSVLLGNGNGTFQNPVSYAAGLAPEYIFAGDFNGDTKLDLAVTNGAGIPQNPGVTVLLGNGDGTFASPLTTPLPSAPGTPAVGDFNGDGTLDVAVIDSGSLQLEILFGNGGGTFTVTTIGSVSFDLGPASLASADFNGDGKLDLVVSYRPSTYPGNSVAVFLGKGNGAFQSPVFSGAGWLGGNIVVADMNGDGKLDLVVTANSAAILLGNGDGTFQGPTGGSGGAGAGALAGLPVVGDVNGDGKPDVVMGATILLGNGDGTLLAYGSYLIGLPSSYVPPQLSPALADFNNDGGLDLAISTSSAGIAVLVNKPTLSISPTILAFGAVPAGETSAPKTVTVSNPGSMPLTVTGAVGSGDFAVTPNICDTKVAVSAHCAIEVIFSPTDAGARTGTLAITDTASATPQMVRLTGIGTGAPVVTLSANSMNFGDQLVGTTSAAQTLTITDTGNATLKISSFAITGNFGPHTFPTVVQSVAPGGTYSVAITFAPTATGTRTGSLAFTSDDADSPHTIELSGTGTDFTLGTQTGGSTSATVAAGGTATFDLQLVPTGFSGIVALACAFQGSTPRGANCSVSPSSVKVNGVAPAPFAVNVTTTARSLALPQGPALPPGSKPWARHAVPLLLGLMMLMLALKSRRVKQQVCPTRAYGSLAATLLLVLLWAACGGGGGGGNNPPAAGTPAGTYNVTLTGTAGGVSKTSTLKLTVN